MPKLSEFLMRMLQAPICGEHRRAGSSSTQDCARTSPESSNISKNTNRNKKILLQIMGFQTPVLQAGSPTQMALEGHLSPGGGNWREDR